MMTWMPDVYYGWRDRFSKRRVVAHYHECYIVNKHYIPCWKFYINVTNVCEFITVQRNTICGGDCGIDELMKLLVQIWISFACCDIRTEWILPEYVPQRCVVFKDACDDSLICDSVYQISELPLSQQTFVVNIPSRSLLLLPLCFSLGNLCFMNNKP